MQYEFQTQNRLSAVTTLLLIALIIRYFVPRYPGRDLNPHSHKPRILNPLCLPISPPGSGKLEARSGVEPDWTVCNPLHNRFVNAPLFCLPFQAKAGDSPTSFCSFGWRC